MIEFIRNLFVVNHEIIYFIYGLMFFVLGLAIALQSRHSSHLELARSLNWLRAAFGFLHGFHESGIFLSLCKLNTCPPVSSSSYTIFIFCCWCTSFTCLYGFGLALLEPLKHRRWLHIGFASLLVGWVVLSLFPFRLWFTDFDTWHNAADALARYFIGLPSGLLAAYALREHTLKRITPYNVPRIVQALQLSGVAMALYSLAAGLIVPPVPFFPGNLLNTDTFTRFLHHCLPQLIRALIGLGMAWTTMRFLEIFDVETARQIEAMQQQQLLANEHQTHCP